MTAFDTIKKYAELRGYNLQKVAEKAGLSKNMIYQYKNVNPKLETLQKIADVLNVTTNDLLNKNESSEKKKIDLNDSDIIFTYKGHKIPQEDLETIKRFMREKK